MLLSKKIPVLTGLFVFMLIALAAIRPPQNGFKNLQVLPKNITEDSLYDVMEGYKHALGVGCGFCHVMKDAAGKEDYASDAISHKDTCRSMMRMTMDINKKYFPSGDPARYYERVTCNTCHRGNAEPPEQLKIKN
jgi:hypothetical protein